MKSSSLFFSRRCAPFGKNTGVASLRAPSKSVLRLGGIVRRFPKRGFGEAEDAGSAGVHEGMHGDGAGGTLLPGVLWAQAQAEGAKKITKEMIENAASIADVPISDEYKEMMLENLNDQAKGYEEIYKLHMPNSVEPALIFDPVLSSTKFETEKRPMRISVPTKSWATDVPKSLEELAFASVRQLAELMRTKKISSVALTEMYLQRLKKYHATLKYVVTLTEERAMAQAKKADAENIAAPCTESRGARRICWRRRDTRRHGEQLDLKIK